MTYSLEPLRHSGTIFTVIYELRYERVNIKTESPKLILNVVCYRGIMATLQLLLQIATN